MAALDWSQCPAVESVPGKRSGERVFRDTRMPVAAVFENLEDMSVEEVIDGYQRLGREVFSKDWKVVQLCGCLRPRLFDMAYGVVRLFCLGWQRRREKRSA